MLGMLPMEIVKKLGMQLPMHMDHVLSRIVILDSTKKEILVSLIQEPVLHLFQIPEMLLRLGILPQIHGMLVSLNVMLGTQKLGMCVRRAMPEPVLSNLPGK